jgi:cell division septation protein DedD
VSLEVSQTIEERNERENMINNQQGGILSKLFILPVGVAFMVGFFFLGYYAGKYQSRSGTPAEIAQPLPEVSSSTGTQKEEFTFYKTLTDTSDKTVSINLKAKPSREENKQEKQQATIGNSENIPTKSIPKQKGIEIKIEKETPSPLKSKQVASKQPSPSKKEDTATYKAGKLHYTVQTASYQDRGVANEEVKQLKKRGYAAFIVSTDIPGKGRWYRVRLGSFSSKEAAENLQKKVQSKEGITPIITIE